MIEKYGFFDSLLSDEREYAEEDFARFGRVLAIDGVRGGENALNVSAYPAGIAVSVAEGMAMVRGRYYALEDDGGGERVLALAAAQSNPRIDRIVLRLTFGARKIEVGVLQGAEAAQPVAPALQRDSDVYMLSLAQVRVGVGVTSITKDNITDERHNEDLCGIMVVSSDSAMREAKNALAAANKAQKTADDGAAVAAQAKTTAETVTAKVNAMKTIAENGTKGNLLMYDSNGNAYDSGYAAAKLGTGATYSLSGTVLTITTL